MQWLACNWLYTSCSVGVYSCSAKCLTSAWLTWNSICFLRWRGRTIEHQHTFFVNSIHFLFKLDVKCLSLLATSYIWTTLLTYVLAYHLSFHVGSTTSTPANTDIQERNGDYRQGSEYASIELSRNVERTTTNVANSGREAATLPGIAEPLYEEARRDPQQECITTLISLSNPMYDVAAKRQNEQSEYQSTQKEVENVLYGDPLDTCVDSST